MRKKWQEWMLADQHTFTASGRICKVKAVFAKFHQENSGEF